MTKITYIRIQEGHKEVHGFMKVPAIASNYNLSVKRKSLTLSEFE